MSADQQADQLDNLSGTPSDYGPHPPQELSPELSSDVDANVEAGVPAEFQAGGPTISTAGAPSAFSPAVDAWPHEDHRQAVEEAPKIRQVALLADETPTHIFSASDGLTSETPDSGQLMVLTNERVIAFCQAEGKQQTYLVPMNEVKHVVVKAGSRSASMLLQGSLMVVAGIFIYLVLGYWLTNQIEGPTIPILHMDVAPFIALIVVLAGLTMIAQVYFTKPDGTLTIQGEGLQFVFPYQGDAAQRQIFDVVNTAFATRQTRLQQEPQVTVVDDPPSGVAGAPPSGVPESPPPAGTNERSSWPAVTSGLATEDDPQSTTPPSAEGQPRVDV